MAVLGVAPHETRVAIHGCHAIPASRRSRTDVTTGDGREAKTGATVACTTGWLSDQAVPDCSKKFDGSETRPPFDFRLGPARSFRAGTTWRE
jgi:hypothetical protein